MKHTAALYTCIGLMGAAAITGFADYTMASKNGELKDLYAEVSTKSTDMILPVKDVSLDDYSRGSIEPYVAADSDTTRPSQKAPAKPRKPKKSLPPPPPPPKKTKGQLESLDAVEAAPPPPPTVEVAKSLDETPLSPPVVAEPAEAPPAPEVVKEEMSFKYFSRGPLPPKKNVKRKKGQ